jgi:hypothetical protein
MNFQPKNLNFQMAIDSIYVYQYHWSQKISPKNSTHNFSFEVCMQFFILYDEYYFITNIFHMLKFTNVCWNFFKKLIVLSLNLIQYTSNKQKLSKMWCLYLYKKTRCKNAIFVITIFWGA